MDSGQTGICLLILSDEKNNDKTEIPVSVWYMAFFSSAITILQTLVVAIGAGLGVWGVINLMEGYGNDNPGANAHVP